MDYYEPASEAHKKKQRVKARELKASNWWRQQLQKGLCYYCGSRFPSTELTMDHKVAVARGGFSTKSNIVPCCKDCNTKKRHLTPAEMILNNKS
ncbi:MAG: HNH endonuclease [Bdellovibrionaceae bacterium]|jgi:5-methylcytosine-specific restriction enzyme A|nr:HNH endonuclease [Pseudobdellovibrionaceae bacterium]